MKFAKRMDLFQEGIFTKLAAMKKEKIKQGVHVVDLSVGAPNIPPAPHIMKTLEEEVAKKENYVYALTDTDELKQAVCTWYKRRYNVTLDADTEVASSLGSQDGLSHFALTLINEGDVVLVQNPCYPVFQDGPKLAGADIYYMDQKEENGYIIDLDDIPTDVRKKAKLMIVSYPNNPTTAIADDSFYDKLIDFAKKYNIIVLHDNAYSELVFDGKKCSSFLAHKHAFEVGVEFNSLSKTYGIAGARVGFCIGNSKIVEKFKTLKSNIDYGMFLPIQKMAIAAITGDQSCVDEMRNHYEKRRNILCDGLSSIGWRVDRCPSTMFIWAKIPDKFGVDDEEFVLELFDKTGVLVTPGSAFGSMGKGHIRMALVQDEKELKYAISQIEKSKILKQIEKPSVV